MKTIQYTKDGCRTELVLPDRMMMTPIRVEEIGHSVRPDGYESTYYMSRACFALHFVVRGEGVYHDAPITAPMAFLMQSGMPHFYYVSNHDPADMWEHYWILFSGSQDCIVDFLESAGFFSQTAELSASAVRRVKKIFGELMDPASYVSANDGFLMLSGLCRLLSLIGQPLDTEETVGTADVIETVCTLVQERYAEPLCNADFAWSVHLSVKYLMRVFKKRTGITPMQYLCSYRIERAKELLERTDQSVATIAESVGYRDPNYFCSVFSRHCGGLSPVAYRAAQRQNSYKKLHTGEEKQ